ncbi:MAG: gliding motility-associated C-terminal domain-containing protein [Flavobacteriales bacterium]
MQAQLANGGFEQNTSNPVNLGQWQVLEGWTNAGSLLASPDYYHYSSPVAADIPETPMALVDAYEGNAIAGLILSGKNHTNVREYLSAPLTEPLEVGEQYLVQFRINNGNKTETSYAGLAASDISVLFTTSAPIQIDHTPILANPQFSIDTAMYVRNWRLVSFVLTADQAYSQITFGIFAMDEDISIEQREGSDPLFAYYFLDDFRVEPLPADYDPTNSDESNPAEREPVAKPDYVTVDSPDPFFVPNSFSPNGDGVNELFIPVANSLKEWEFSIYDVWGEQLFFTEDETIGWDGSFANKGCPAGSYVWKITYWLWDDKKGYVTHDEQGIVVLLR